MSKSKLILSGFLILQFACQVTVQAWDIPEVDSEKLAPFAFDRAAELAGKQVFEANCKSCHGIPSEANFQPLVPTPGDPASEQFGRQTDGGLFYKITNGRGIMPAFKTVLSSTERWQVVAFFRSFHKGYEQQVGDVVKSAGAKIIMNQINKCTVSLFAFKLQGVDTIALQGEPIILGIRRYFGNLPIGKSSETDENGRVEFVLLEEIPGDINGDITLVASFLNDELYGGARFENTFALGERTDRPALNEKRAMWNVMRKAPLWLLIVYFSVVVGVYGTLAYIVMQLKELKKYQ